MKPHPRIRKFFKWGGLAGSIALCAVWIGSAFVGCGYERRNGPDIEIVWGRFSYDSLTGTRWQHVYGFYCEELSPRELHWTFDYVGDTTGTRLALPLWPFVAISIATTAAAWRMDMIAQRRKRLGECPACGYDRAGLAAGAPCPECNAKA